MGFKVNFTENQSVAALDLNAISEGLSGEKTNFSDGVLYGVSDLNAISKSIITSGVSSGLLVSILNGGEVFISQGTAFFADGRKITVDSDGITLVRESTDKTNYVWLLNDEVTGVVSAKCTIASPSGDCVKLAEISKDGTVTMKKDVALLKNSSLLPNYYREPVRVLVDKNENETVNIDAGGNFRRMVIVSTEGMLYLDWDKNEGIKSRNTETVYDLTNTNNPISISLSYSDDSYVYVISYKNNILTLRKDGGWAQNEFTIYFM